MPENVELKCRLRSPERARALCAGLGARYVATLDQTDRYYRVADGRLKRRETRGEPVEWILYRRDDRAEARPSRYELLAPAAVRARFGDPPGPLRIVVRKRRELWRWEHVRIHLDEVDGLGPHLELEALVLPEQPRAAAERALHRALEALAPALGERLAGSYADLLEGRGVR